MEKVRKLRSIAVYCGSATVTDPAYDDAAVRLATLMAANDIALVYGGSDIGTMKVLADAMLAAGGHVVGVFTQSLHQEQLHLNLSETVIVENLAERKAEMIRRADALVALPGGFGTLDELFDAIAMSKMVRGGHQKPIALLNVSGYYDPLLGFLSHAMAVGYIGSADEGLLLTDDDPEALLRKLGQNWTWRFKVTCQ